MKNKTKQNKNKHTPPFGRKGKLGRKEERKKKK